jgi:transcriptional regulator GlxA family with amidase domain
MKAGVFHICVRFRPGVGASLLRKKAYTLTDSHVPFQIAEDFDVERLLAGKDLVSRRLSIELFVKRLLSRDYRRPPLYLSRAIMLIHETYGDVRIHNVAGRLGVSLRQLERSFQEGVGMGPKLYARIVRVRAAWDYLKIHPERGGAEVAALYGFADQAHLIKEMHVVLGRSSWLT